MSQNWKGGIWVTAILTLCFIVMTICITYYEVRDSQIDSRERIVCMREGRTDCR